MSPEMSAVTVTASGAKGLEATLALAETLARDGYVTVPHLAARMISGRTELVEIRARLGAAGITRVFVPGGDVDPVGDYPDAFSLLEDLATLANPFEHVGITGYPETHPKITDDLTVQAMWDKRRHATHVVSNLTFDAGAIKSWVTRMRARGVAMPVLLGMPGPVDRTKLLAMAGKIGVGESTRFLVKHKSTFARLAAPGGFTGRAVPRAVRDHGRQTRRRDRGPAHLHLQPDRRDRGLAPGPPRPPLIPKPPDPSQRCTHSTPTRRKGAPTARRPVSEVHATAPRPASCTAAEARRPRLHFCDGSAMFSCTSVTGRAGRTLSGPPVGASADRAGCPRSRRRAPSAALGQASRLANALSRPPLPVGTTVRGRSSRAAAASAAASSSGVCSWASQTTRV